MILRKRKNLALACCFLLSIQFIFSAFVNIANADLWDMQKDVSGIENIGTVYNASSGSAPTDIRVIVGSVVRVFLGLLGIIFVVLILLAGYKWMTAAGDSSKVDQAKEQLNTGVIGLLIVLAAYGITIFVMRAVLNATNTNTFPGF